MSDLSTAERRHVFHSQENQPADTFDAPNRPTFAIRLVAPARRWSLRMDETRAAAFGTTAPFDLTQPINALSTSTVDGDVTRMSARLGPDEWLLIADGAADDAVNDELITDLNGAAHTLVDISHRHIALEITGARAADVINAGCPLDLGDRAFPVGMATRTLFAKTEIVLMRCTDTDGAQLYRIECWRSFGRYLHGHLLDSAALLGLPG